MLPALRGFSELLGSVETAGQDSGCSRLARFVETLPAFDEL